MAYLSPSWCHWDEGRNARPNMEKISVTGHLYRRRLLELTRNRAHRNGHTGYCVTFASEPDV
jgi:hypothetical protein